MTAKITRDEIETIDELVHVVLGRRDIDDHLRNLAGRVRNIMYLKSADLKQQRKARERKEIWPVTA